MTEIGRKSIKMFCRVKCLPTSHGIFLSRYTKVSIAFPTFCTYFSLAEHEFWPDLIDLVAIFSNSRIHQWRSGGASRAQESGKTFPAWLKINMAFFLSIQPIKFWFKLRPWRESLSMPYLLCSVLYCCCLHDFLLAFSINKCINKT